jgi:hypothetical protein
LQEINFNDSDEFKVLKTDLAYIHANFSSLSQSVTEFIRTKNVLAETRMKSVSDIQNELNGSDDDVIKQKFNSYFNKNEGFKITCKIPCLLKEEELIHSKDVKDSSLSDIV